MFTPSKTFDVTIVLHTQDQEMTPQGLSLKLRHHLAGLLEVDERDIKIRVNERKPIDSSKFGL